MALAYKFLHRSSAFSIKGIVSNSRFFSSSSTKFPSLDTIIFPSLLEPEKALRYHQHPQVKFLDGSWHLGKPARGHEDFLKERISNSQFFDLEEISDKSSSLPHMLPSEKEFSEAISNLGISSTDQVIVYTVNDAFSAARVWWTFKVFGHQRVSILKGGLNGWKSLNGPLEHGKDQVIKPAKGNFIAKLNKKMVVNVDDVSEIVLTGSSQILDARSAERFNGKAPEPRPNLAGGNIPGSLNLPFGQLFKDSSDYTTFKSLPDMRKAFQDAGIIPGSRVVMSCGSGVTAAVLAFGLHQLGKDLESVPIYDGSWSEWGADPELPKNNPSHPDQTNGEGDKDAMINLWKRLKARGRTIHYGDAK